MLYINDLLKKKPPSCKLLVADRLDCRWQSSEAESDSNQTTQLTSDDDNANGRRQRTTFNVVLAFRKAGLRTYHTLLEPFEGNCICIRRYVHEVDHAPHDHQAPPHTLNPTPTVRVRATRPPATYAPWHSREWQPHHAPAHTRARNPAAATYAPRHSIRRAT